MGDYSLLEPLCRLLQPVQASISRDKRSLGRSGGVDLEGTVCGSLTGAKA